MTAILGISAFYHDSAAALVRDGRIVAAAQEERFSRKKHDADFPAQAIAYCLEEAGLKAGDVDYLAFYEKPLAHFERLLETYLAFAPRGLRSFCGSLPVWLKEKLHLRRLFKRRLGRPRKAVVFLDHHECHAASAFFPSPFEEAAILTLDGVGEWTTTAMGVGSRNHLQLFHHLRFPHSLGLLYSAFTDYCGFAINDGEYKLMGLAPYGKPRFRDQIYQSLLDHKSDGSFRLNLDYFNFCQGSTMTNHRFARLFGGPRRRPEKAIEERHMDLAASIQAVTEEMVLSIAQELHRRTGLKKLVMAGGVALNCVANGRLLREGPFESLWIQPAAGDAGGALGAALFVWHQLLKKQRVVESTDTQQGSFLGPGFSQAEIETFLKEKGLTPQPLDDQALFAHIARLLAQGKVVGWFRGRMEFGPRALGARSILADPRRPEMQALLNEKVKLRESFRPFAPAVLAEEAETWFDLPRNQGSPYMLLVATVKEGQRVSLSDAERVVMTSNPDLSRRARVVRSSIPAVTHVDYSARVQTVDARQNKDFHGLLKSFFQQTRCPLLVNTSFNLDGQPIVCTPKDAFRAFQASGIDVLVLEQCVIEKVAGQVSFSPEKNAHAPG